MFAGVLGLIKYLHGIFIKHTGMQNTLRRGRRETAWRRSKYLTSFSSSSTLAKQNWSRQLTTRKANESMKSEAKIAAFKSRRKSDQRQTHSQRQGKAAAHLGILFVILFVISENMCISDCPSNVGRKLLWTFARSSDPWRLIELENWTVFLRHFSHFLEPTESSSKRNGH